MRSVFLTIVLILGVPVTPPAVSLGVPSAPVLRVEQPTPPLKAGEAFKVQADHNGADTANFELGIDAGLAQTLPVTALANGSITFLVAAGLPAGSHQFVVTAVGNGGRASSGVLSLTIDPADPIPVPRPTGPPTFAKATPMTLININFQAASSTTPVGYLADTGLVYGSRGNGQTYGWSADNTAQARERGTYPDKRYDTLNQLQRPAPAPQGVVWELAVSNGDYDVRLVAGDPNYFDSTYKIEVEGILVVDGVPTASQHFVEGTRTVTVADGKLTIKPAAGSVNAKVCFIEVTPR